MNWIVLRGMTVTPILIGDNCSKTMIYELLTIPDLPRLKVSVRIGSGAYIKNSIKYQIFANWIGWVIKNGPMSNPGEADKLNWTKTAHILARTVLWLWVKH